MILRTVFIVSFLLMIHETSAHGSMIKPPQRGLTNGFKYWGIKRYHKWAKTDWYSHFPAGDKSLNEGAGLTSQIKEAGNRGWVPYNPRKSGFRFRAGVCGDLKRKPEHLRGGIYYNKGMVTHTYQQNGTISIDIVVTNHHNGFFEFRLCDVRYCGGEISESCLRGKHCYLLQRVKQESCESRKDWKCAPIDPAHPSRWYLPCPSGKIDFYGGGKMVYQLPENLHCKHCVLQWYWAAGNSCNPPGLERFFKSSRRPMWKHCPGQGHARNGWRRWLGKCNGRMFSEEYFQCSDVRILRKKHRKIPLTNEHERKDRRASAIQKLTFYANGVPLRDIYSGQKIIINVKPYKKINFRCTTNFSVRRVQFYVEGKKYWSDTSPPYFLQGDSSNWKMPVYNRSFKLQAWADGSMITAFVTLKR